MPLTTPLISAAELRAAAPAPLVLDCSFDLVNPAAGAAAFGEGHLPGAVYVHLDHDLSGPKTGSNGRHPLRTRDAFAAWMGSLGITPDRDVVVCDRQGGMFAGRAWWVLRWMGHRRVSVLDGGVAAWVRDGGVLTAEPSPTPAAAPPYPTLPPAMPTVDADAVRAAGPSMRVIDARAPERYRGDVEPLDRVAGHIPGACNRFFQHNLGADGRFKPAALLRAEFNALSAATPAERVVMQCGSGVTACHNLLAFEVAGLGTAALYPGSWSEWSADPARPVERGDGV